MCNHVWLASLAPDTIEVFATAYTLSARKRGCRVSTQRFLAALPAKYKRQMTSLCADAQNDIRLSVNPADLPAPELCADWQEKICFSYCVESTLHKCAPGTDVVAFLKLLCSTACALHCIVDKNMPVEEYLSRGEPSPPAPLAQGEPLAPDPDPERWQHSSQGPVEARVHAAALLHLLLTHGRAHALASLACSFFPDYDDSRVRYYLHKRQFGQQQHEVRARGMAPICLKV